MSDPPNFHVSYEKLKKISEELLGGGDKDAEYWAWRNGGSSESESEDDFKQWLKEKRSAKPSRKEPKQEPKEEPKEELREEKPKRPGKRSQRERKKMRDVPSPAEPRQPALWEPGDWGKTRLAESKPAKASKTARGGGVLKLPGKVEGRNPPVEPHSPIGVIRQKKEGPGDFVYSDSQSDSDGVFSEDYVSAQPVTAQLSTSLVLNVVGIEKKVEKCTSEAVQCSSTYCKESCNKFITEGVRKRNSLDVLYDSFDEHHTEIIHLRQELASVGSCAMMFDLELCQEQQVEAVMWKDVFYLLIQHYRSSISKASQDSLKATLAQQLEEHLAEAINFYNMLVRQVQKRYKVNYKHPTAGHSRVQVLALLLLHKIFLWIGDLYRYLAQTREVDEWGQARTYYLLAQTLAPRNPRPYHQLALLGKYAHRRLHAVHYFCLSLLVRNPFPQSKEMLMSTLAELRRKAILLEKRDKERNKRARSDVKEVVNPRKTVEWVFGDEATADPSVNIPVHDLKKRFVVYLLSALAGLLTSIDVDRVDTELANFTKFYRHYIEKSKFAPDESFSQLFIVFLYAISSAAPASRGNHGNRGNRGNHGNRCVEILEQFLLPAVDEILIRDTLAECKDDSWLCSLHSQLSLIMLLTQVQSGGIMDVLNRFSATFKERLCGWLNVLRDAIQRYKKYTDFTEEMVVLKEVTILRGTEVLASLQTITRPFYLGSLTREQSEDLGRAVIVISAFEGLAPNLPFLSYSSEHGFSFDETAPEEEEEASSPKEEEEEEEEEEVPVAIVDDQRDDYSDDSPDVEIMEQLQIGSDSEEMTELREKRDQLRERLELQQVKEDRISRAVKELQGKRILITVRPRLIVPDTNCFIDSLAKIKKLVESYRVVVPLLVLDEVRGLCRSETKAEAATTALDVLEGLIRSRSVALLTSKGNIMESGEFREARASGECNDDVILAGVRQLSDNTGTKIAERDSIHYTRTVVFLTNDGNLRVKAHALQLAVISIADFVNRANL